MKRVASVITVTASGIEEYERLHTAVWPDVLEQLKRSRVANYSIYRHNRLLFSYLEYLGDDFAADMAAMAADPATQQWWAICMPLQRPVDGADDGQWWHELPELFHLD